MIRIQAALAAVLGAAALQAHASKFPGPDPYFVIGMYAGLGIGMLSAAVVFAIRLARVCHPSRSRRRQAILGAILGPAAVYLALSAAFVVWLSIGSWLSRDLAAIAAVLAFLGLIYGAYRLSTRYAASAPRPSTSSQA